ncbi:MAG: AAA family ATPase, partial [Clostridia bacterium]|nr:AAA family ATPase [Clostridia bacterium]
MKIDKIQINDFGRFSNKEIDFKDRINIIKGNNEAGKSTIQKFIVSMFYGISNDKRKSSFTDYDKYYPWGKESFSGKLKYTLDNGRKFEIYRDFTKKVPILYNDNAEDITNNYNSTKSKGSSFFEEQTGIDELTMTSSIVTEQGNVIVDQDSENFMIQKIANMAETGDEKISYEKAQSFLTKKRNEEVGTVKTKNRPINIINKEKRECLEEKNELEQYNDEKYEIEERINDIKANNEENNLLLKFATEYKKTIDKVEDIRNKADIYTENKKNNIRKKEEIEDRKKTIEEELEIARKEYDELTKKEEEEKN